MLKKVLLKIYVLIFSFVFIISCNKDFYSVGIEIFDQQFNDLKSKTFPIFSYQQSLEKVQTNNISSLHLGTFDNDLFGRTNSGFISQLNISTLQTFGLFSQEQEIQGSPDIRVINENEQLTAVYLELPYFNNTNDADSDGVIDIYDADPSNPLSDSDNDGVDDITELRAGLNPLSNDSDNDGILDLNDSDNETYNASAQVYQIDSIFGNRNATFDIKVSELTYFLNNLDPKNNFESQKEYFSDDDFYDRGFYGETLHDGQITLNFEEIPVLYYEDDLSTPEDEISQINYFDTPRLRVPLNINFFQGMIVNQEGSDQLTNQTIFNNYFKGLIIKAENFSDDLYMSLDLFNSRILFEYNYNFYNTNGTDDVSDDFIEKRQKSNSISLGGVAYNLYKYDNISESILTSLSLSKENIPSDKIYLNGTKFISKLKLFSNDNSLSSELQEFKDKDVLINEANIILHLDQEMYNSNYEFIPKRLYLYSYNDGVPIEDFNKDFSINYNPTAVNANKFLFGGLLQYDSNNKPTSYKFNITNHVSNIVRHDSLNIDIGLTTTSNVEDISIKNGYSSDNRKLKIPSPSVSLPFPVSIFGSKPNQKDLSKQLKLEVIYTEY
tara:strand:- start:4079 stop:5905 length:1827 start_codon:yes stop_codon:yes gene_type:complete